ncbi:MAG: cyclic-phosphate processing receiver domain-containing protein [Aliarcobacter sp.]|nr:cyclic-phosphate processing receiver domain-containing protein [Aliarcobacter sp.]
MKLYLDDIRTPKNNDFIIVRSFQEAVKFVQQNGIPNYISFDHDLGCDEFNNNYPSGYDFAKWLIEMNLDNVYKFPKDFKFNVHSANPIGKANIEGILNNYFSKF